MLSVKVVFSVSFQAEEVLEVCHRVCGVLIFLLSDPCQVPKRFAYLDDQSKSDTDLEFTRILCLVVLNGCLNRSSRGMRRGSEYVTETERDD